MQVVFDSFDAAKAACDKTNKDRRKRPLSVYRVFNDDGREKFVVALAPEQALGRGAEFFGLRAERWPPRHKETPQSLLEGMTVEQMKLFQEVIKQQLERRARLDPGEEA